MRVSMFLMALFISSCASEYAFEKGKFNEGKICKEMLGVWFTDITVQNQEYGKKRDITRLDRNSDGTAYLKGVSLYLEKNEISDWEFPTKWSCSNGWYVESNEWGYTSFKVVSFGESKNVLFDEKNNMNAPEPIEIVETKGLSLIGGVVDSSKIKAHLGL